MLLSKTLSRVERDVGGAVRARARGDDDDVAPAASPSAARPSPRRRPCAASRKRPWPAEDLDPVAPEGGVDQLQLALDDEPLAVHEVGDRDVVGHLGLEAVEAVARHPEEEEGALAERLRGDRPPVHAGPADDGRPLDEGDALAAPWRPGWRRARRPGRRRGRRRRSRSWSVLESRLRIVARPAPARAGSRLARLPDVERTRDDLESRVRARWLPASAAAHRLPVARAPLVQRRDVRQLLRLRRALPGDAAPREGLRLHGRAGRASSTRPTTSRPS